MTDTLTMIKPDDLHLHVRDGEILKTVINATARRFARAIIMPNLKPPVVNTEQALAYQKRIQSHLTTGLAFQPLMTLYLTEHTQADEIRRASQSSHVFGVKYYPAGATTHSEYGVRQLEQVYPALEAMAETGLPLLVHGEVIDPDVDVFDRERIFIDRVLEPLLARFATLRVVLEHITTQYATQMVMNGPPTLAATITPHHLLLNRNALFSGGLRPHYYCLPVLKAEAHRQAVLEAAVSGHPRIFLGTDSAPHPRSMKESDCGCAGIYTALSAIELYAEVFDAAGQLDRLEAFASIHGADFYGLPQNDETITLEKKSWTIPATVPYDGGELIPFRAGEVCQWMLQ